MKPKFKNEYSIGTRIKECREDLQLSRNSVCDQLDNLALSTLQKWENNEREPSAGNIIKLAKILKTTVNYLLTGEEPMTSLISIHRSGNADQLIDIPAFDVRVSAGFESFNEGMVVPTDFITFSREWLEQMRINDKELAIFWVSGDSMNSTIENGDMIIVDRTKKQLKEGQIFVIQNAESIWVKRIREDWNAIELLSDNEVYKPIRIPHNESEHLQIVGEVVYIGHPIN